MVLISFSLGIGIEVGLLKYVEAKGRMVATMGGCWSSASLLLTSFNLYYFLKTLREVSTQINP